MTLLPPSEPPTIFCSHCNYDLRAHQPGARCPECGTPIPTSLYATFTHPTLASRSLLLAAVGFVLLCIPAIIDAFAPCPAVFDMPADGRSANFPYALFSTLARLPLFLGLVLFLFSQRKAAFAPASLLRVARIVAILVLPLVALSQTAIFFMVSGSVAAHFSLWLYLALALCAPSAATFTLLILFIPITRHLCQIHFPRFSSLLPCAFAVFLLHEIGVLFFPLYVYFTEYAEAPMNLETDPPELLLPRRIFDIAACPLLLALALFLVLFAKHFAAASLQLKPLPTISSRPTIVQPALATAGLLLAALSIVTLAAAQFSLYDVFGHLVSSVLITPRAFLPLGFTAFLFSQKKSTVPSPPLLTTTRTLALIATFVSVLNVIAAIAAEYDAPFLNHFPGGPLLYTVITSTAAQFAIAALFICLIPCILPFTQTPRRSALVFTALITALLCHCLYSSLDIYGVVGFGIGIPSDIFSSEDFLINAVNLFHIFNILFSIAIALTFTFLATRLPKTLRAPS